MDSAEILFCLLDSLDNCDIATESSVYSTVVDFAKSTTASSNCVGLVSNAITSFLQVSHTSVNHQLSLLRLLSLIISSYAISNDTTLNRNDEDELVDELEIVNATNFSINNDLSVDDIEFFDNLGKFILNEYICLKQNDSRRVALLQVLISLVFLIPEKLIETLLSVIEDNRINVTGSSISSVLIAISAISKIFPEIICSKGHDIIVELLSLLHKVANNDTNSKNNINSTISKVELVRCLADVADALRSNNFERVAFAGLIGTAFDALLNDWVPAIQKDKDVFYLSFPTLETLGHLAQVIDDEQLIQHAPKLLSVYLQILNSLLSKKNKYFPTFLTLFLEPKKDIEKYDDLLQNNIYTLRWRQYHNIAVSAITPLLTNKSETIAISLHYSILSGFKLFLDRCHVVCNNVFDDQNTLNSLFNVLIQYCAIFHRLYAPALLPGHVAHMDANNETTIDKEVFESKNGYTCSCWNYTAIHDVITTHYELVLCWKSLIRQDLTRESTLRFLFDNIDIKSANRLSAMFIFRYIIVDLPFEKVSRYNGMEISICENSNNSLGNLMYRIARTTLEQGLDYCIAFILCETICELAQYRYLHIGSTFEYPNIGDQSEKESYKLSDHGSIWISPSPSSAEMLTYFLRLLAVPESKAKNEHFRHLQRQKTDYLKNIQGSEGNNHIPVFYPPSLWDLRRNAQYILSEELTTVVPDLLWPLLIDAVNHLKLGSAMPIVCESLSKSCNNLYQKSTPEVFFSAFRYQGNKYLTVSDPYKIFVWLCMYAHDPHIYGGFLAYWSLQCLKWIAPMIISSPSCIWACIPSQRLQNIIDIIDSIISSRGIQNQHTNECNFKNEKTLCLQESNNFSKNQDLSSKIDIDCWFPLVDECISFILSSMSENNSEVLLDYDKNAFESINSKNESSKFYFVSEVLVNLLSALFSACKDIRSDKIQKYLDTPTELQRAGMYSLLGLLLKEISGESNSETGEIKNLIALKGKFIISILDGLLIPDTVLTSDSISSSTNITSNSNINSSLSKTGGDNKKDALSSSEMISIKDLTKQFSDLQHFFHAIGINTSILQRSCARSLGYTCGNHNNFVIISEYLLDLVKSDVANKRSSAFSFFGKSLAVVQAEQLRSTLLLSLGHCLGEAPVSLFNSAIETVRKILSVLEIAIKEEKEHLIQCSTLRAIQVAFQALSSTENPELTLSSKLNSVLNRSHSGEGFGIYGSYLKHNDISIELFTSFRDNIFPYILTIIVFSATIELPPVPLNSTLLLKAASGMPYSTSSSISSQRIHTDPSGPYIRSMVRYRDISINATENFDDCNSDINETIYEYNTQNKETSVKINRSYNLSSENDDLLFGPFNLTLAVLSVLSENPLMTSESSDSFLTSLNISQNSNNSLSSNAALKGVISNLSYMKLNNRNIFGITKNNSINEQSKTDLNNKALHFRSLPNTIPSNGSTGTRQSISNGIDKSKKITNGLQTHLRSSINSGIINNSLELNSGILNEPKINNLNISSKVGISSGTSFNNSSNKATGNILSQQSSISSNNSNFLPNNNSNNSHNLNSVSIPTTNMNNNSTGNSTNNNSVSNLTNPVVFNNLLLSALDASISLISLPSPLLPQHIPLVVNSCLTILLSVSSRIQFKNINGEELSNLYSKDDCTYNLSINSLAIIDGGFKLEEMMNIIEDNSVSANSNEVSVFKILDSLDRLYLNIYKSHMPSWAGLTHLLEGLLGLAATTTSSVLRCICIHVTYCLISEAPLVEVIQTTHVIPKMEDNKFNSHLENLLPKGTWVSWMHCIALILGRTCDSCIYVRLIAFECIKECIKRCIWTQSIDVSQITAIDFTLDHEIMKYSNNKPSNLTSNNFEMDYDKNTGNNIKNQFNNDNSYFSDLQSIILPPTYLNLLYSLASNIPAFCLRPLCQHILPSFHDADKSTAHSSVETVRVFFSINKHILESESFACKIVSSLFDEIPAIKDSELQHFVYLLIRNVVSNQFQAAVIEIFKKCIQPQKYVNCVINNDANKSNFIENIVINNNGTRNSEWTTIDFPIDSCRNTTNSYLNNDLVSINGMKNIVNIIFVVDPIYSKAISYIGKDKNLLLESFRYLTDVLNNTEQRYTDIVEVNEKLCINILSSNINTNNILTNSLTSIHQNSLSPVSHNSSLNNIGLSVTSQPSINKSSLLFPLNSLSFLSNEHIYLRSSTLALDILLQTNDSAIKIIAKKHFPELISTILLRCCSTLGYINMGALESCITLRSLFLALFDSDALLTYFDANQIKLSLIKPNEFDSSIMKLLCYVFTQKSNVTKPIISFIKPFLKRVHSVYSMGAIIILATTPLGIYHEENLSISKQNSFSTEFGVSHVSFEELYNLELLETILNIIKVSNNPYTKKNGFVFFQWYFWYCLESSKYPKIDFIFKFINICFNNIIGNSLLKNQTIRKKNIEEKFFTNDFENSKFDERNDTNTENHQFKEGFKNIKNNYTSEEYGTESDNKSFAQSNEESEFVKDSNLGNENIEDYKNSYSSNSENESSFVDPEEKLSEAEMGIEELDISEISVIINNKSVIADLLRECLISLRYLICIISQIHTGSSLQIIPSHPPIYLNVNSKSPASNNQNNELYESFIKLLFSELNDQLENSQLNITECSKMCENRVSDIFIDLITNSDIDIQITIEKLYLFLDILILIKQSWEESKPDQEEMDLIRSNIKKLLIPLLVRLEEPIIELSRSVWRAVQLILSIILDENEWIKVINEINKKLIMDDLIVQNSTSLSLIGCQNSVSSPLLYNMSPTSINRTRINMNFSNNVDRSSNDSLKKLENRLSLDDKIIPDIESINVNSFELPYELIDEEKKYQYLLPKNYRFIRCTNNDDASPSFSSVENFSIGNSLNLPSSKLIQIKYTGECEILNKYLLPILNPIESNNYQQFLNCIIPFIISSETLREGSTILKQDYQRSESQISNNSNLLLQNMFTKENSFELEENKIPSNINITRSTLKELERKIEDCHLYLNRCRYYFPREVWEITETAFSTIPKELDRIRKEAETQHLLFNRNIFGEMVNCSVETSESFDLIGQKSFLNKDLDLMNSVQTDSSKSRFSFGYSQNSGVISIPSFARTALSRFNTLWNNSKSLNTNKDNFDKSVVSNKNKQELRIDSELNKSDVINKNIGNKNVEIHPNIIKDRKINKKNIQKDLNEINSSNESIDDGSETLNKSVLSPYSSKITTDNKLPDTLSQQLNIKKMELISEYIKYPITLKNMEKYSEQNEDMKANIEGISAILASTFVKYISIEFFQHFYTSEILMLLAYRELSNRDLESEGHLSDVEGNANCLENEELMVTIDKLMSLESLISAICKQISTFVAQSQSPSRHRFAKALANLVYISYKP